MATTATKVGSEDCSRAGLADVDIVHKIWAYCSRFFAGIELKSFDGTLDRFLQGKHEQDKKMYCINEQTKSRYSSLNSIFVSL